MVNFMLDFSFWFEGELFLISILFLYGATFGHEDDLDSFLSAVLFGTGLGVDGRSDGSHRVMHLTLVLTFFTNSSTEGWKLEGVPEDATVHADSISKSSLGDPADSLDMALLVQELPPALSGNM